MAASAGSTDEVEAATTEENEVSTIRLVDKPAIDVGRVKDDAVTVTVTGRSTRETIVLA